MIKADGTERIIDSSDYQDVEEGKKGKDKRAKLAVPDLQIGDLLIISSTTSIILKKKICLLLYLYFVQNTLL